MPAWIQKTSKGIILKVHIVPNSSKTFIVGEHGDRLKLKIKAPPVDGKANEEIIEFLCKKLSLKRHQAALIHGHMSKSKDILFYVDAIDASLLAP